MDGGGRGTNRRALARFEAVIASARGQGAARRWCARVNEARRSRWTAITPATARGAIELQINAPATHQAVAEDLGSYLPLRVAAKVCTGPSILFRSRGDMISRNIWA